MNLFTKDKSYYMDIKITNMFILKPIKSLDFAYVLVIVLGIAVSLVHSIDPQLTINQTIVDCIEDSVPVLDQLAQTDILVPDQSQDVLTVHEHRSEVEPNQMSFVGPVTKTNPAPNTIYSDYEIVMWLLKRNESLRLTPYWDVKQWTSGWGTKAKNKDEVLTLNQANERAREVFQEKYNLITKEYPKLDKFTRLVIAQFIYNVGDSGIKSGLHRALRSGNKDRICRYLALYVNAGGEKLEGLVERRQREIDLLKATPEQRQKLAESFKDRVLEVIQNNS